MYVFIFVIFFLINNKDYFLGINNNNRWQYNNMYYIVSLTIHMYIIYNYMQFVFKLNFD